MGHGAREGGISIPRDDEGDKGEFEVLPILCHVRSLIPASATLPCINFSALPGLRNWRAGCSMGLPGRMPMLH